MFEKFSLWFVNNRKPIGYTVGGLNLLAAVNHALYGNCGLTVLWLVIGSTIIYDTKMYK